MLKTLQKPLPVAIVLVAVVITVTAQRILLGPAMSGGKQYTNYNNYKIFSRSYSHLIENKNLYELYPEEHYDYYKYSPTFALLMASFALVPDAAGLLIWNLLNVLVLFAAIWQLPLSSEKTKFWIIAFILIELVTSLQSSQSNGLMAGLIILGFVFLEKKKLSIAALCIALTVFIKLFGIAAYSLFLLYPGKIKAIAYSTGWILLLALCPLIVISPSQLWFLYKEWLELLIRDQSASYGISVQGWLHSWFQLDLPKNLVVLFGAILLLIPLFRINYYSDLRFRLYFLSSLLIWLVIFNHKAESPTFIIGVTGIATWYFSQSRKPGDTVLLILAFIFTILSPTDIFPVGWRKTYIVPYVLKVLPCILIWFRIIYEMTFYKVEPVKSM